MIWVLGVFLVTRGGCLYLRDVFAFQTVSPYLTVTILQYTILCWTLRGKVKYCSDFEELHVVVHCELWPFSVCVWTTHNIFLPVVTVEKCRPDATMSCCLRLWALRLPLSSGCILHSLCCSSCLSLWAGVPSNWDTVFFLDLIAAALDQRGQPLFTLPGWFIPWVASVVKAGPG